MKVRKKIWLNSLDEVGRHNAKALCEWIEKRKGGLLVPLERVVLAYLCRGDWSR